MSDFDLAIERLRERVRATGIPLKQFAKLAGLSHDGLRGMRDDWSPRLGTVRKIEHLLDELEAKTGRTGGAHPAPRLASSRDVAATRAA